MNLKNYTTSVPVSTTIARIESFLMECGASGIAKQCSNGTVDSLFFEINVGDTRRLIKLPANIPGVHEWFWREYLTSRKQARKSRDEFKDQASRTAWRIMEDWVRVQVSLIKLKQADFLQVFLPYLWDGNQTYYEFLKESKFKQLPAPKP